MVDRSELGPARGQTPAQPPALLEDNRVQAGLLEVPRCGQAGQTGANDGHALGHAMLLSLLEAIT